MATDSEHNRSAEKHRHPPPEPEPLSADTPHTIEELVAGGYMRWSKSGDPPLTRQPVWLLAMGWVKWTRAGRDARDRRMKALTRTFGLPEEAEFAAEEERTLP